jgi:predicted metal-binding membrane protein
LEKASPRILIPACVLLITVLAWVYLVHLAHQMSSAGAYATMMAEMGMSMDAPWTTTDVLFTFVMWAVMMIGMMAPAATPVLLLFAAGRAGRGEGPVSLAVLLFGSGYVAVWTGFSAAAALAQWGLHQAAMLSAAMSTSSRLLGGGILLAAGVYQITPVKGACLAHCRSPLAFLMSHWRGGRTGAFRMGLSHGTYCLGCCWALMCVLFVVGVMNLAWVAALSAFVLLEKVGPAGVIVSRVAGAIMVIAGGAMIAGVSF